MADRLVIDGFNLLHRWAATGPAFRAEADLAVGLTRGLRLLAGAVGRRKERPVVALDGTGEGVGLPGALSVRFAGSGRTADALIEEIVRGAARPRDITVVTSDRTLGARITALGARVESAESFAGGLRAPADDPDEQKPPPPSRGEVAAWLDVFGDGSDILDEEA